LARLHHLQAETHSSRPRSARLHHLQTVGIGTARLGGRLYDCDGGFVLRGVASGVGLLWAVVVAGLTGGGGFTDLRKEKKKFLCWVIKKFPCGWFYHFMFFNFYFIILFFSGNHFLEFLIKIIFIKKINGNIIISFSIFKDPNGHIFQRSYSFSINRTISYL
jgi:hypothetical protein